MEFRRGMAAIEAANTRNRSFGAFCPEIRWREDKEDKFILVLTPIDNVITVDLHEWIEVGKGQRGDGSEYTRYESFISREEMGEKDDLKERLDVVPRTRSIGIAVELEPVVEVIKGRQRPKSFVVKTETFTRDGDEVEAPQIGLITQSPKNYWGWLSSFDATTAPITETPIQVVRRGKDASTEYDFIPYTDIEVDLTPLLENVENIGYLYDKEEELLTALKGADDDTSAAIAIGDLLLEKRVSELADKDRYDELVSPIQEIKSRFNRGAKKPRSTNNKPQASTTPSGEDRMQRFAELREELEKA